MIVAVAAGYAAQGANAVMLKFIIIPVVFTGITAFGTNSAIKAVGTTCAADAALIGFVVITVEIRTARTNRTLFGGDMKDGIFAV